MTIIEIPGLDRTFTDWQDAADYMLLTRHPGGPATEAELSQTSSNEEWDCPTCDAPVTRGTVLLHAPCLLDEEGEESVPSLGFKQGARGVCPICREVYATVGGLRSHLKNHETETVASLISSGGTCLVCKKERHSPEDLENHESCVSAQIADHIDHGPEIACPVTSCTEATANRGSMYWHIWENHFDIQGLSGTCPGCDGDVDIGHLKDHISHLDSLNNPDVGAIIQSLPESCSVCGFSPFGPKQLWTHYKSDHDVVAGDGTCRECGEPIPNGNLRALKTHLLCLLNLGSGEASGFSAEWPCPACSTTVENRSEFFDHLESHPELLAFSGADCHLCGDPLTNISNHLSCIAEYGCGLRKLPPEKDLDITLPFQETRQNRTHSGRDRLSEQAGQEQANKLYRFIQREMESAREENRERYEETDLRQLGYETDLIYDLVTMGQVSHPDYGTQVVFERPVPDHEHNPESLTDRFNIYPRQEVIVGCEANNSTLPMEAVVTFTDDQRIGVAPASHESASDAEFTQALTGDGNFHVVSLLHPTPFDRERESVELARERDEWDIVRGATQLTEQGTRGASLYAGRLNESQQRAVNRALGAEQLMCIHGPPGTGKTQTLTALIELAVAEGERVLACAHSNQATDNLLTGGSTTEQTDLGSLHATVQRNDEISMLRAGGHSRNQIIKENYLGGNPSDADIVGVTANAAATLQKGEFDLVVVDEATQASQPSTIVPWLRGGTLVLAGDHHQLPPYASDEMAKEQEMHISLFEYLSRRYGDSIMERLSTQYRMHSSIANYSNQMFYDGELQHGEANKSWTLGEIEPLVGYHVEGDERTSPESHSKYNPDEARVAAKHIEELCAAGVSPDDIGVVTPYGAQIGVIASELGNRAIDRHKRIDIDTVDSYQGSEREVIVVSFVRSNPYNSSGFLAFPDEGYRRLNVALTRAKKHLALIGDWETLGTVADHQPDESCAEMYAELESYIEREGQLNRV